MLRQYNAAHRSSAIHSGAYDENTSFCFVDRNTIKAVILTHQREDVLYVDWLASDSGSVRSLAERLSFVPQTELEGRLYKHYVN